MGMVQRLFKCLVGIVLERFEKLPQNPLDGALEPSSTQSKPRSRSGIFVLRTVNSELQKQTPNPQNRPRSCNTRASYPIYATHFSNGVSTIPTFRQGFRV